MIWLFVTKKLNVFCVNFVVSECDDLDATKRDESLNCKFKLITELSIEIFICEFVRTVNWMRQICYKIFLLMEKLASLSEGENRPKKTIEMIEKRAFV